MLHCNSKRRKNQVENQLRKARIGRKLDYGVVVDCVFMVLINQERKTAYEAPNEMDTEPLSEELSAKRCFLRDASIYW